MVASRSSRILSPIWKRILRNVVESTIVSSRNISSSLVPLKQHLDKNFLDSATTKFSKSYPQPVFESHPNLLKKGEITPLIHKDEYKERRSKLMQKVFQQSDGSKANIVVVQSSSKLYMSGKIPYVFRQDSDFFYLTGCLEPDVVLVMVSSPCSDKYESILFIPKTDLNTEVWEGPKLDLDFCVNILGIEQANYDSQIAPFVCSYIKQNHLNGVQIWRDHGRSFRIIDDVITQKGGSIATLDYVPLIHNLRVIKSKSEQELMRRSCSIIAEATIETMKKSKPSICESQLWACVEYHSRMSGAQYLAYPPVVAGGPRANTIHYINNNQLINNGEMVLMDAGCQYHGYTSDMTRCWPINGKFTSHQTEAYEALLDVQLDLIQFCNERPPLDILFQRMCRQLGKNLQQIGFGKDARSCVERAQMAYSVCPHHVSHYLGIDVHDTGKINRNIPLETGMVITIEPGLYVDLNRSIAPKEFHGLGLRIEDDILITETGVEVLTQSCPKTVAEIESIMR
ncbi:xaa-Pro aminopeptidase 3-like [Daphnia pulex]|uniref:xaa-Pro aminopeptidase 3-like n=1 Tax=Daphnia pulex TaxID=6669 RepID=UPI001EE0954E|nr:xaa-Pro aminopeptidase 3-like [Daphnia pulex]